MLTFDYKSGIIRQFFDTQKIAKELQVQFNREAIIAYLKDPENIKLQYRYNDAQVNKSNNVTVSLNDWEDMNSYSIFNLDIFDYRVKPIGKWYRVALMTNNVTATADSAVEESHISRRSSFVKWITDRIEYD